MNSSRSAGRPNQRRTFLRNVVTMLGGAAALALPLRSKSDDQDNDPSVQGADKHSKGYRETEHVQTYYEKARF